MVATLADMFKQRRLRAACRCWTSRYKRPGAGFRTRYQGTTRSTAALTIERGHMVNLENRRILFVEDDYLLATEMAEHLAAAGAKAVGPAPTPTYAPLL